MKLNVRALPLFLASLAFSAGLAACAVSMGVPRTKADALPVALFDAAGRPVGTVLLTADSTGLDLKFDVHDLAPGTHGVHIHAAGRCERPDFLTAGAHLDDGAHHHGRTNPDGWHLGDRPGDPPAHPEGREARTEAPPRQRRLGRHHPRRPGRRAHRAERRQRPADRVRDNGVAPDRRSMFQTDDQRPTPQRPEPPHGQCRRRTIRR